MGVIYTLADHKNRLLYDLDKASGLAVALCEEKSYAIALTVEEFGERFAVDAMRAKESKTELRPYLHKVVVALFEFCQKAEWDVTLLCDSYDEEWLLQAVLGYRYSGSRMACSQRRTFGSGEVSAPGCDRPDCVVCPRCGCRGCAHAYPKEHDGDEERDAETRLRHSAAEVERYVAHLRVRHLEAVTRPDS